MSNKARMVNVRLYHDHAGLLPEDRLVANYSNLVVGNQDDQTIITQVAVEKDVKDALKTHNEKITKMPDLDIRQRTGNEVNMLAAELIDLRWEIVQA